jgi:peptide/nickel transport system substrate-binding protein
MNTDKNLGYGYIAAAVAVVIVVCALLGGCSSSNHSRDGGTLNFLIESMPVNLDPRVGTDANSQYLDGLIFSSLVAHDAEMNIVPDLAERWETPDPSTYVLHLRRGVKFHDGRTMTSADVKYTFETILKGDVKTPKRGTYRMVASVEAPDDATIVFHLREPYASFLWNLTRPGVGIVPRGSTVAENSQHPNGTGPFRFVSATADEDVVLERNVNYFGWSKGAGDAHTAMPGSKGDIIRISLPAHDNSNVDPDAATDLIERVRFRVVPDAIVRALELRKGTADLLMNGLTPDMSVTLAKDGLVAEEQPGTMLGYIAFNFDDSILARREVRQALAYATDRATLIRYLMHGQARPASGLLPPNHWANDPNVKQYDFDPAQAERLLDAAGFPRGADGVRFHLELKSSTEESARLLCEALADEWKRVGIKIDLRPLEFATFYADIVRGSFQLYTHRWVGGNNDPDMFEYVFSSKKIPPDGANRGHYRNAALDAQLDQQRVEMDRDKRKALLSEIQKIVAEDEPYINLWYWDNVCVHQTRVANVTISPTGDYEFLESATLK